MWSSHKGVCPLRIFHLSWSVCPVRRAHQQWPRDRVVAFSPGLRAHAPSNKSEMRKLQAKALFDSDRCGPEMPDLARILAVSVDRPDLMGMFTPGFLNPPAWKWPNIYIDSTGPDVGLPSVEALEEEPCAVWRMCFQCRGKTVP